MTLIHILVIIIIIIILYKEQIKRRTSKQYKRNIKIKFDAMCLSQKKKKNIDVMLHWKCRIQSSIFWKATQNGP